MIHQHLLFTPEEQTACVVKFKCSSADQDVSLKKKKTFLHMFGKIDVITNSAHSCTTVLTLRDKGEVQI